MNAPARFRTQTVSSTPHYRVAVHRVPSNPREDGRLQLLVDDCIESFRLASGHDDGARSALLKFWAGVFERQAEAVSDVAA